MKLQINAEMMKRWFPVVFLVAFSFWDSLNGAEFESDFLSVEVTGKGSDVILVHGFACQPEVWDGFVDEFGGELRLHRVALAGHAGEPAAAEVPESFLSTYRDELVRYTTEQKLEKPVFVGHSMGGLISLLVAAENREVPGQVVVVDALPFLTLIFNPLATATLATPQAILTERSLLKADDESFAGMAASSIAVMVEDEARRETVLEWSKQSDRKTYACLIREMVTRDARPELAKISCPVTVLHGFSESGGTTIESVQALYAGAYTNLKGVDIKTIPDSGHFVMWDQPERFHEEVREVLGLSAASVSAAPKKKSGRVETPPPTKPPLVPVEITELPEGTDRLDLYLLIGQSNMKGRGFMPEEPKNDPRIVMMHLRDDQWYRARHPLHLTGDAKTFKGHDNAGVGPGLVFAEAVAEAHPKARIGLIPAARGGSAIQLWSVKGNLYANAVRKAKLALEAGPKGATKLRGVLWLQGEADAKEGKIENYPEALVDLVDRLRKDLGDPELPFLAATIGEITDRPGIDLRKEINEILLDLPNQRERIGAVDARDLKGHIGDAVHYDTASQEEIGRRFAEEYLSLIEGD